MSKKRKESTGAGRKILLSLILAFLLLTGAVYALGFMFFQNHYYPGTVINNFRCDFKDAKYVENLMQEQVSAYVLAVNTMYNGREAISAEDVNLTYLSDGEPARILKEQDSVHWYNYLGRRKEYNLEKNITYDNAAMDDAISSMNCMNPENTVESQDAYVTETADGFVIVPEVEGNTLDVDKVRQLIGGAMQALVPEVDLLAAECYIVPKKFASDSDLIAECDLRNTVKAENEEFMEIVPKTILTYDFADRTERLEWDTIEDWVTQDEVGRYILDSEKMTAYVKELAEKYDTAGNTREFSTYDRRTVTISGGDYGWVIDQPAEVEALKEAILAGTIEVREPVYAYTAFSRDQNDIGLTYIEIDLTAQRLVYYRNGYPTVDAPAVTGMPYETYTETPTGCFSVQEMRSPAHLSDSTGTVDVSWWLRFYANLGIHDAPWRDNFNSDVYLLDGTGGCVNISYDDMRALYSYAEVGLPVVIYK